MAFDAFFQLWDAKGGMVNGESMDETFGKKDGPQAIELSEFSFGAENTVSISSATGGAGAGKATFKEFTCKKLTDTASPDLFIRLCQGTHYKGRISIRKSGSQEGASGAVYLVFEFGMLFVKGDDWSGSSGDDTPTESVVFMFGELAVHYKQQDDKGSLGRDIPKQWSAMHNSVNCKYLPSSPSFPS